MLRKQVEDRIGLLDATYTRILAQLNAAAGALQEAKGFLVMMDEAEKAVEVAEAAEAAAEAAAETAEEEVDAAEDAS